MQPHRIVEGTSRLVDFLTDTDYRIDEKITICRAAADLFSQIMTTESLVVAIKESMQKFVK
ncbi:hypothetical protein KKH23_08645 [Patescibacteria group bacterium]|nr:hypothetical protein [Patescibacteria group bacterium]